MCFTRKQIIFLISVVFFYPGTAAGESGLDFLLKNTASYEDVVVEKVRNSNTIILKRKTGEVGEVIQLIGLRALKAPKNKKANLKRDQYGFIKNPEVSPLTPIEEQAFDFTKELLEGKHVRLEFDSEKKSEDFITLAYVFLLENDVFVNIEILRQGFAYLQISPPNIKYVKELREAYKEARTEKRGLQSE